MHVTVAVETISQVIPTAVSNLRKTVPTWAMVPQGSLEPCSAEPGLPFIGPGVAGHAPQGEDAPPLTTGV